VSAREASTRIEAILLDIEGTTTPIAFVADVLFPYARRHLRRHLEQLAASPDYASVLDQLRTEHAGDERAGEPVAAWVDAPPAARLESAAGYAEWLMDRDRKSTALKILQGTLWEKGYQRGELVGEVFADVPPALARWQAEGVQVGIFSSGSVLAQQLLFRHSSAGDLTPFLRWYFDTTTGKKADRASYQRIASAMNMRPESIVFLSDVVAELDAARDAGLSTRLSIRPGNAPPPLPHDHPSIRTFDEISTIHLGSA
jgi:enolase-phosphatase E1